MNKKILLLFFIAIILLERSLAQTVMIHGVAEERQLQWKDFMGPPDKTSPYDAHIYWNIRYRIQPLYSGDSVKVRPDVVLEIGEKSWVRRGKQTKDLLKHEQGHFDIGRLCARELTKTFELKSFTRANVAVEVSQTFQEIMQRYKEMERAYDLDTNHSKNVKQQKKWEAFFASQLKILSEPSAASAIL